MRLNGGAGNDIRPKSEWVNIDIRDLPGIDVVGDVRNIPFADGYFEEALFQDVIEHFPFADVEKVLQEWWRVIKPEGTLSIRTPDFLKISRALATRRLSDEKGFLLLFGDQSPEAGGYEFGGHKSGYSKNQWGDLLKRLVPSPSEIIIETDEHQFNLLCIVVKPE